MSRVAKTKRFPKHGPELRALLAACHRDPDDDTPRLVLADWLQEHDDPRGELMRLQCRLAAMPAGDPEYDTLFELHQQWWKKYGEVWEKETAWQYSHSILWDIGPHNRGLPTIGSNRCNLAMLEVDDLRTRPVQEISSVIAEGWPEIVWVEIRLDRYKESNDPCSIFDKSPWVGSPTPIGICFDDGREVSAAILERVAAIPNLRGLSFCQQHASARLLPRIRKMTQLEQLDLGYIDMNDDRLKSLASLSQLRLLRMWPERITDKGMKTLANFPELRELVIEGGSSLRWPSANLSASGFKLINSLTKLESLAIPGITDRQLRYLSGLTRLRKLEIEGAIVSGQTVAELFPLLHHLDLSTTNINDVDLGYIGRGLPRLRYLSLWETAVTDAGTTHLSGLRWLEDLTITDTQIGNEALPHLEALPNLQELRLDYTNVTQAGIKRLERKRKGLRVFGGSGLNPD